MTGLLPDKWDIATWRESGFQSYIIELSEIQVGTDVLRIGVERAGIEAERILISKGKTQQR